jgi:hypothetical protein
MRSRYRVAETDRAHFVTSTIVEWLPVFTSAACCDILVQSLVHCREDRMEVIVEDHPGMDPQALVLTAPDLSAVLRDFKSFTAKQLLEQLGVERREWLLHQLRHFRIAHKPSEYQVWQEGSHPQAIHDDAMMEQKLDYLHNNPVQRGWVASPEHWRYSSAHEWLPGALPLLKCDPWR